MKNSFFILSMSFFLTANSQGLTKQLRDEVWYTTNDILKPENVLLNTNRYSTPNTELKFLPDNTLQIKKDETNDFTFVCMYQLKKDMIKIYYTTIIEPLKGASTKAETRYYYKINSIQNGKNLEFISVTSAEFK